MPISMTGTRSTNVSTHLRAVAREYASKTALMSGDRILTCGELDQAAMGSARWFLAEGLMRGDRVAIQGTNTAEVVVQSQVPGLSAVYAELPRAVSRVVGLPDAVYGERVVAFVPLAKDAPSPRLNRATSPGSGWQTTKFPTTLSFLRTCRKDRPARCSARS